MITYNKPSRISSAKLKLERLCSNDPFTKTKPLYPNHGLQSWSGSLHNFLSPRQVHQSTPSFSPLTDPYSDIIKGTLFTHWIADSLTLWKSPVTDEHLWIAASYYNILAKGPWAAIYALGAVVLVGAGTILWSLRDGEAGNLMFDGASICEFRCENTPLKRTE